MKTVPLFDGGTTLSAFCILCLPSVCCEFGPGTIFSVPHASCHAAGASASQYAILSTCRGSACFLLSMCTSSGKKVSGLVTYSSMCLAWICYFQWSSPFKGSNRNVQQVLSLQCELGTDADVSTDFRDIDIGTAGDDVGMVLSPQCFHNLNLHSDIFNHSNVHFWEYMQPGYDTLGFISCTGRLLLPGSLHRSSRVETPHVSHLQHALGLLRWVLWGAGTCPVS